MTTNVVSKKQTVVMAWQMKVGDAGMIVNGQSNQLGAVVTVVGHAMRNSAEDILVDLKNEEFFPISLASKTPNFEVELLYKGSEIKLVVGGKV